MSFCFEVQENELQCEVLFSGGSGRLLLDNAEVRSPRALTSAGLGLALGDCLIQAGHKIWPKG